MNMSRNSIASCSNQVYKKTDYRNISIIMHAMLVLKRWSVVGVRIIHM